MIQIMHQITLVYRDANLLSSQGWRNFLKGDAKG
jgi:hypothetical protein